MLLVLGYAIPALFIMSVALGLAFVCVMQYRLASAVRAEWRLAGVLLVVGVGALLSIALTTRDLDETKATAALTYGDLAGGFAASRWLSLFLVVASLVEIARGWIEQRRRRLPDPAQAMLVAMLAYYVGTVLIQSIASEQPEFNPRDLYLPILLAAIWYQRTVNLEPVIATARLVILMLMLGSLAGIALAPDFVLHRPEPGVIPGIDWRLYGLTQHANTIGPVALLGILIELHAPARWWPLRALALLSSAAVLVLAQSKTTWGTVPLMLLLVWLPLRLRASTRVEDAGSFRRAVLALTGVIVVLVLLACAAAVFDVSGYLDRRIDLATLTGRTKIWDITLHAWRQNVLFGYGAGIWGPERQAEFQMFYVGHAHNQVVQTLGESGLVGLALLLVYLCVLLLTALRRFVASRGFVLMLLMLMLVQGISEAPMRSEGLLSWSAFLHALLLTMACHFVRAPSRGAVVHARSEVDPRHTLVMQPR